MLLVQGLYLEYSVQSYYCSTVLYSVQLLYAGQRTSLQSLLRVVAVNHTAAVNSEQQQQRARRVLATW
jgi:hypothetical protein